MTPETTTKREPIYNRPAHIQQLQKEIEQLEKTRDLLRQQMEAVNGSVGAQLYKQTQQIAQRIQTKQQIIANLRTNQPSHGYATGEAWTSEEASGGYHVTNHH